MGMVNLTISSKPPKLNGHEPSFESLSQEAHTSLNGSSNNDNNSSSTNHRRRTRSGAFSTIEEVNATVRKNFSKTLSNGNDNCQLNGNEGTETLLNGNGHHHHNNNINNNMTDDDSDDQNKITKNGNDDKQVKINGNHNNPKNKISDHK